MRRFAFLLAAAVVGGTALAAGPDPAQWQQTVDKAAAFLAKSQDPGGSWSVSRSPGGAWTCPPAAWWPRDTVAAGPSAARTPFTHHNGKAEVTIELEPTPSARWRVPARRSSRTFGAQLDLRFDDH